MPGSKIIRRRRKPIHAQSAYGPTKKRFFFSVMVAMLHTIPTVST
jgi:hypothetical protein